MIKKIYSSTSLIDSVDFHGGINLIVGKYSQDKNTSGINGIGKSSLVRLIDYCFISDSAEKIFQHKKYDFLRDEKHSITLEFKVQRDNISITRTFKNDDPITYKENGTETPYEKSELRAILTNKFFPTIGQDFYIEGDKFRSLMRFFIASVSSYSILFDFLRPSSASKMVVLKMYTPALARFVFGCLGFS